MGVTRVLVASIHGYVDPSSGAAWSTRERMELIAARGVDCRVVSTGVLDYRAETPIGPILAAQGVPVRKGRARLAGGGGVEVYDFTLGGVRVTLLPTASSLVGRSPDAAEAAAWLDLATQALGRFRPQVLSTYGGTAASLELMGRARRMGIAVTFNLHNFEYRRPATFADAAAVIVPSEFARRHYAEALGLDCVAIPNPIDPRRVVADDPAPRFATFINPVAEKGVAVFARIAAELGRRRPEIPLLVVEGRAPAAEGLARTGVDLSGAANLHRMASTPDIRDIYRVSRAVIVPSLWRESLARVVIEAMMNGVPVLASDRGGLPETVGDGGFLLPVPDRCTVDSGAVPTAEEVAPWVATLERLWDDPAWEAQQRARARAESARWDRDQLVDRYLDLYAGLVPPGPDPEPDAPADWLSWIDDPEPVAWPVPASSEAPSHGSVLPLRLPPPRPDPLANFRVIVGLP